MTSTTAFPAASSAAPTDTNARPGLLRRTLAKVPPELWLLLVLAAALNLINLSVNGTANSYYAAAVRSMSESWHAFLYGSFDAASLQMVDKPPLALWVQALSVRIFGFSSLAILVPQALMGVAAVGITYDLVRRPFGRAGGFVAGLTLALTPTAVAVFRHNNPDALVLLLAVASVWAMARGLEHGKLRWFAIAGLAVGLGFMTKMGAGLLVVPGILAAIFWMRVGGTRHAVKGAGAFSLAALVSGAAWPILVWLTPEDSRPWVSGTSDNSIWSLITGYNGLGRLVGQDGGPGGTGAPGGGGAMFGGDAGPLRLLNDSLGSQGGWLLGAAVFAGLAILVASRLRPSDHRSGWLIAVGGAFVVSAVAFSFASGIFHPYYVSEMAPFTAALIGGGFATMLGLGRHAEPASESAPASSDHAIASLWDARQAARPIAAQAVAHDDRPQLAVRVLGGAMLIGGAVTTAVVLGDATPLTWLAPLTLAGTTAAAFAVVAATSRTVRIGAATAAIALLLAAPAVWSAQTLGHATNGTFPTGGPASSGMGGPSSGPGGPSSGMGGPSGRTGGPGAPGGRGGFTPGGAGAMPAPPSASGSSTGAQGAVAPPSAQGAPSSAGPGGAGGGMFGGDASQVSAALAHVQSSGGGTLVVASQAGAASSIISSGADVAGIGGFSGRESEVSAAWLGARVEAGELRWVLTDDSGIQDNRTGSRTAMSAVAASCTPVSSVDGLYDCQGQGAALRSAS